ncbi:unnamed protein product [Vitrella brassicaformis CCMP3155]|uniref:Potassium channel tetramerisation-type BTB domain-containing protein n=2 Tax=Vitrella brassicaformis TaxID=1169539 RepID=A0A0G4FAD0_VITBC|nr:unnamed protein product [Vitrella brassicaformis CCMP3155]|eukprot:CEM09859.1 unnamed protein product [Vitrella brassicaformis CCMP3155]
MASLKRSSDTVPTSLSAPDLPERFTLNVGGKHVQIQTKTLLSRPDDGRSLIGHITAEMRKQEVTMGDSTVISNRNVFLDRNSELMDLLLMWFRQGEACQVRRWPTEVLHYLIPEADHFGLLSLRQEIEEALQGRGGMAMAASAGEEVDVEGEGEGEGMDGGECEGTEDDTDEEGTETPPMPNDEQVGDPIFYKEDGKPADGVVRRNMELGVLASVASAGPNVLRRHATVSAAQTAAREKQHLNLKPEIDFKVFTPDWDK